MTVSKEKVNVILARKQLTAVAFCESAGMSRNRFYTILNSKSVAPRTAGRIAAALGVDVTEIIETD